VAEIQFPRLFPVSAPSGRNRPTPAKRCTHRDALFTASRADTFERPAMFLGIAIGIVIGAAVMLYVLATAKPTLPW